MSDNNKARLFVGGLKREVEKDEMEAVFSPFGELVDTWIAYDPPGFAFVEFKTNDEAAAAMTALHKTDQFGSEIRLAFLTSFTCSTLLFFNTLTLLLSHCLPLIRLHIDSLIFAFLLVLTYYIFLIPYSPTNLVSFQ